MKRSIVAAVAALALTFSFSAVAGDYDVSTKGLSPAQVLEIQAATIKLQQANAEAGPGGVVNAISNIKPAEISKSVRTEAGEWGAMGKNMGSALISMAKEMGVAVNEFAQTDLGKIATAVIVYKLIGHTLINMVVGFLLLTVGLYAVYRFWRKATTERIEYQYVDRQFLWFKWQKKVVKNSYTTSGDAYVCMTLVSIIFAIACFGFGLAKVAG